MRNVLRFVLLTGLLVLTITAACGTDNAHDKVSLGDIQSAAANVRLDKRASAEAQWDGGRIWVEQVLPQIREKDVQFSFYTSSIIEITVLVGAIELTGPLALVESEITTNPEVPKTEIVLASTRSAQTTIVCTDVGSATYGVRISEDTAAIAEVECVAPSEEGGNDGPVDGSGTHDPDGDVPIRLFVVGTSNYIAAQFTRINTEDGDCWTPTNGVPVFGFDELSAFKKRIEASSNCFDEITGEEPVETLVSVGRLSEFCDSIAFRLSLEIDEGEESSYPILNECLQYTDSIIDLGAALVDSGTETPLTETVPTATPTAPPPTATPTPQPVTPTVFTRGTPTPAPSNDTFLMQTLLINGQNYHSSLFTTSGLAQADGTFCEFSYLIPDETDYRTESDGTWMAATNAIISFQDPEGPELEPMQPCGFGYRDREAIPKNITVTREELQNYCDQYLKRTLPAGVDPDLASSDLANACRRWLS